MSQTLTRAIVTWEEIQHRFDGEWVLLEDPITDERMEILSGTLLCHSKDRAEIDAESMRLRPRSSAIVYVGEPSYDSDEVICLNL